MSEPITVPADIPGLGNDGARNDWAKRDARDLGSIVTSILGTGRTLFGDVTALGRAELKPTGKHIGIGIGMFAGAGVFAICAFALLLTAGGLGIAQLLGAPTGLVALGFVIMAVIVLVITVILALIGKRQLDKAEPPHRTIAAAKDAGETIQQAISRSVSNAKTHELVAKNFDDPELYGYR